MNATQWYLLAVFALCAYGIWRLFRWLDRDVVAIGASRPCKSCMYYRLGDPFDCHHPKGKRLSNVREGQWVYSDTGAQRGYGEVSLRTERCGEEGDWWKPRMKEK